MRVMTKQQSQLITFLVAICAAFSLTIYAQEDSGKTNEAPRLSVRSIRRPLIGVKTIYANANVGDTSAFEDMLLTALVNTRKFEVIERSRMRDILREQTFSEDSGLVEGRVKKGQIKGVDYLILGKITHGGLNNSSMSFGGEFATRSENAELAVDLRVVDAQTGELLIADTVRKSTRIGGGIAIKGIGRSRRQSDYWGDVMRATADAVVEEIVASIFPIKVLTIQEDNMIILNYGAGMLERGALLDVFALGTRIVDPETGEDYGAEESKIGRIQVVSVQERFSKCQLMPMPGQMVSLRDIKPGTLCRPVVAGKEIKLIPEKPAKEIKPQEPRKSRAERRAEAVKAREEKRLRKEAESKPAELVNPPADTNTVVN